MTHAWARVAKNASILVVLKILVPALSLGLVFAVSHFLGTEGLGRYTLVLAYFYFFVMVTPLGLDTFLTREGVREAAALPALLGNAAGLGVAVSLLAMGILLGISGAPGYDAATQSALRLMSLAIVPSTLLTLFEGVFVARQRFEYIAASSLLELTIKIGGSIPLLFLGYRVQAVVGMIVASRVLACGLAWGLLSRVDVSLQWSFEPSVLRKLLQAAPTFLCISVFAALYWRIDTLMLSVLRDLTDVGYYGAAYRIMDIAKILPHSLCRALYPRIAQSARTEPNRLNQLGSLALRYLWVVLLPLAGVVTIFAEPILVVLYGEAFRPAALLLTILIWTVLPYAWVRYYAYVLIAADCQRVDLRLNMIMAGVNVVLNWILIPHYGPLGAALATCVSICL
ncbi:MAG: flippase, partial [Candidatus Tectomicrobia bacterium]|nr:flippase [Candidatus Tectomicrobia bacterium]